MDALVKLSLLCLVVISGSNGKVTFFIHVDEVKNPQNLVKGGSCCQGANSSLSCPDLCKPLLRICLRDSSNHCTEEISTTLHMEMNDVIYGSVIGNTTNPLLLEVDHWDRDHDYITVEVYDRQQSVLKSMITTAIHDQFLVIGKDILSQYWSQKHIQANYFVDKNLFSINLTYKAYCSEGYYGPDCTIHCPGNITKCVFGGNTYCKTGKVTKDVILHALV
ncbi:uncharacterized protein LOC111108705 [Crassostrea virginica]